MTGEIRKFDSGATRDTVQGKLDYVKALCPLVLRRYVQYLNKHRLQSDGNMRDFDNWKKGIPRETYHSSKGRHFFADWLLEEGYKVFDNHGSVDEEDALCGEIFNAMGKLREILKAKLTPEKSTKFIYPTGWKIKFEDIGDDCGWYVKTDMNEYLHKDNRLHKNTTGWNGHKFGEAPGYWPTKEAVEDALRRYLEKGSD